MKQYENILFDFDGTIIESGTGVLNGIAYALEKFGLEMPQDVPSRFFMGPPLTYSFVNYCRLPSDKADDALRFYREYYSEKGIMECSVYPGVGELLKRLSAGGKRISVASSKPEVYIKKILRAFNIDGYFTFIGGADLEGFRTQKEEVLAYVIKQAPVADISSGIMVGDRFHDILGAKAMGMDSIGVLYGYGTESELLDAGATYIAKTAEDVAKLLLV